MHALPLAAADFGDWLKLIVGVGAILFYIINHLINESTQSRTRQQQRKAAAGPQCSGETRASGRRPSDRRPSDLRSNRSRTSPPRGATRSPWPNRCRSK
jgi:hypothetical protein